MVTVPHTDLSQMYWQEIRMHIQIKHPPLGSVALIVRRETEERLRDTCFRSDQKVAGNFQNWRSSRDVFNSSYLVTELLLDVEEASRSNSRSNSVSIDFSGQQKEHIGWSGTDDLEKFSSEELEPFTPNRRSNALRVRPQLTRILAPRTRLVTLVYELRHERSQIAVIIHSLYPGPDIGEVRGNITKREGRVFFDWNHPGE